MTIDDVYDEILMIVSSLGAQVDVPIESEQFFCEQVEKFNGDKLEFIDYVKNNASSWYRSIAEPPRWMQEAEWQFTEGRPMVFVGQINVDARISELHDEAAFYVFWSPATGELKTILQVA